MSKEVITQKRIVSRDPSGEIDYLTNFVPDLTARGNYYICGLTSINFIGSLLAHLYPETSQNQQIIDPAIKLIPKAPLIFEDQFRHHLGLGIEVNNLLVKTSCGKVDIGVVLEGAYAGLIVDTTKLYITQESSAWGNRGETVSVGGVVCKLWNDELLNYYIDTEHEGSFGQNDNAFLHKDYKYNRKRLVEIYKDIVRSSGFEWTTELFFDLCQRANIPVDKEAFHFTRSYHPENE